MEKTYYLDAVAHGLKELKDEIPNIQKAIQQGEKQAETRDGIIDTINEMCDALQLACDLISSEVSKCLIDFNQVNRDSVESLKGFFERTATKFSDPALRVLLHDGKVCGQLHALGDRFCQPFSNESTGALSFWENIRTLLTRSNAMSDALNGLHEGELHYLQSIQDFLREINNMAETTALSAAPLDQMVKEGEALCARLREKREALLDQIREIRIEANACIGQLH